MTTLLLAACALLWLLGMPAHAVLAWEYVNDGSKKPGRLTHCSLYTLAWPFGVVFSLVLSLQDFIRRNN